MKNIVLGLVCLVSSFAIAQTKMTTTEAAAFKKEVQSEAGKTTSITADFEETKHVSVLKNASTSTGIFRFKGEKLLWQYNAPKKSAMLFNKQNLKIKSEKGKISTIDLNKKQSEKQIKLGLLSIKDLQKNNYTTFIKIINIYLNILGFKENTILPNGDSNLTNFKSSLNNEEVFISCIQNNLLGETPADEDNWELTGRPAVQSFLGRILINNCKKGILITNSSFSDKAIEFANDFNNQNRGIEIKLIDGYELAKSIRNHNYYITKEGIMNEVKYNI